MIKIVYLTKNAENLAENVKTILDYYLYDSKLVKLSDFKKDGNESGYIFIMASGIVLRKFIDEIKNDKLKDPFVIIMDEAKNNIVPLLSNHIGKGNYFSELIGNSLGLNIVKTTATDSNNKVGVDELSRIYFLEVPKRKDILLINKKLLSDKPELVLPNTFKPINNLDKSYNISFHDKNSILVDNVELFQKTVSIGIGSKRNIEKNKVYWAVKKALYLRDIPSWRIDIFSTVDAKKNEDGILKTTEKFKKNIIIFENNEINELYSKFPLKKSEFVYNTIGAYGVSEPCAILGALSFKNEKNIDKVDLILKKMKKNGVSVSIAIV
ncbi:cobalamin (vitamin B12) biosynthesis CbiG protein [Methanococcus vannielii SB]|uniref:Cobalamin (Vitamin B12) biosynthesis CbiG protein n=1 Tax=Methanococcus vannielii (strain ATCC 35089 / DSM 1224 / JCM 13029 / OCM 148 / SB) TaxID=406327 RepID=A6UQN6_METVS|nr:cobalamin biosynthesis protein [Methanococcus vannielii]ABR54808.1 cobalamin (vitamin B12) biosynthesis CbiG protein [Methanococcus vannielii SB]